MGEALTLARGIGVIKAGEVLAFPGTLSETTSKELGGTAEDLIRNISLVLDSMVRAVISRQTAADFIEARDAVLPKYTEATLALSSLLQIVLPKETREQLNWEFFSELEANLREHGLNAFGTAVRDQGMFTVWTLRKISDYLSQISQVSEALTKTLSSEKALEFIQLGNECVYHAFRTRFHVNCLVSSMETDRRIHSDVLDVVIDGLRSVVNTYALTRKLLDIAVPRVEPQREEVAWDEEDQALLREASLDPVCNLA